MKTCSQAARRSASRPVASAGFTLLEVVIVLALLAGVAALAWPQLQSKISRAPHRAAALQLKADFSEAREQAIHDGRTREFRLKPGTGEYVIAPRPVKSSEQVSSAPPRAKRATQELSPDEARRRLASEETTDSDAFRELPDDMIFRIVAEDDANPYRRRNADEPRLAAQTTASSEKNLEEVFNPESEEWVLGARFFPDGRATETTIELEQIDSEETIAVEIRGLTGGVKIGAVTQILDTAENSVGETQTRGRTREQP